jgi:chromate transporter
MPRPSLRDLSTLYFRIGNITFGGGDPTMAALQRELVGKRSWLSPEEYGLAYSLARITPGTNMLAFCAATGWMMRGWAGAVATVATNSIPSGMLAVWLVASYQKWQADPWVTAVLSAVVAAVAGMIAASVILLVKPQVRRATIPRIVVLLGLSVALPHWTGLSPVSVMLLGAVAGYFWKEPSK